MKILHGARCYPSTLVVAAIAMLGTGPSYASTGKADDTRSMLPLVAYASLVVQPLAPLPATPGGAGVANARTLIADSSGSGGSGGGDRKLEEKKKKDDKKKKKKQAWDDFIKGVQEDTKEQEKKQKSKSN